MLFFGPCTVKHGGVDLGKTLGGISIDLISYQGSPIGSYVPKNFIVSGEAIANFYQWPSTITLSGETLIYDWGIVLLDGSPDYLITLNKCKILFDMSSIGIGTNEHTPIKMRLVFKPDASGNIINIA